jgi:hypothetical protein
VLNLHVHAAQRPLGRSAVVVLHECHVDAGCLEFRGVPGFHEKSAVIAERLRLDEDHVGDRGVVKFHGR